MRYKWEGLEMPAAKYKIRDLWEHKELKAAKSLTVKLAPHASVLYRLEK